MSTSQPLLPEDRNYQGLFIYTAVHAIDGKLSVVRFDLPCLLEEAILCGQSSRALYKEPGMEHLRFVQDAMLYDDNTLWCGHASFNLSTLIFATPHVAETHVERAHGLCMLGLDTTNEASYEPAIVRVRSKLTRAGDDRVFVIPLYGHPRKRQFLNDPLVTRHPGTHLFSIRGYTFGMDNILTFAHGKCTHAEHEALSEQLRAQAEE